MYFEAAGGAELHGVAADFCEHVGVDHIEVAGGVEGDREGFADVGGVFDLAGGQIFARFVELVDDVAARVADGEIAVDRVDRDRQRFEAATRGCAAGHFGALIRRGCGFAGDFTFED